MRSVASSTFAVHRVNAELGAGYIRENTKAAKLWVRLLYRRSLKPTPEDYL